MPSLPMGAETGANPDDYIVINEANLDLSKHGLYGKKKDVAKRGKRQHVIRWHTLCLIRDTIQGG